MNRFYTLPLLSILFFICFEIVLSGDLHAQEQGIEIPPVSTEYLEMPDDDFIPVNRDNMSTSAAFSGQSDHFFFTQVNINANGENILGDAGNEPSIAVDPTNPNRMVIGWRQFDTTSSNFRQAGFAYTTDGGDSWTFPGVIDPGVFRSDPVLAADSEGNFYYNSLTRNDADEFVCDQYQSTGDGTWDEGTFAQGGDKQWMTVDNSGTEGDGHIYAHWNEVFSVCSPGHFTRSTDNNFSFEDCVNIPEEPFWGTLAVGPDGELYASGVSNISFDIVIAKSTNAKDATVPVSWDFVVPASLGGFPGAFSGDDSPNPVGLLGQVWVDVDRSDTENRGNVYMLSSITPNSGADPSDVIFIRSVDGGQTWTNPIKINDDNSNDNWQWFGTMSVAPNGRIDAVWLDTRVFPQNVISQLYYSYSEDGGLTWTPNEILVDTPFDPHLGWPQQNKMGDYFHMVSDDTGAHLAWAATFNGEQDVYYGRISGPTVSTDNQVAGQGGLFQNYPNPFYESTSITYSVKEAGQVQLTLVDQLGRLVDVLVDERMPAGDHTVQWDRLAAGEGVYFYQLEMDGVFVDSKRLMVLK